MTAAPHGHALPAVAALLSVWTLLSQTLAAVPVAWLDAPLHAGNLVQTAIVSVGVVSAALGAYNVVLAVAGLALAWTVMRGRARPAGRVDTLVLVSAAMGLTLSVVGWTRLVLAAARAGAGVHPFAPAVPFRAGWGAPDRTVTLGRPGGEAIRADLYLPRAAAGTTAGETAPRMATPVAVYVHGGGFAEGSRRPNALDRWLADHGYAVLDVDYRLAAPTRRNWETQVGDVGCALTWLARNSAAHGFDTARVALLGGSAGGNLAINAAYMSNARTLRPTCGTAADLPRIAAVVGGYPAVDVAAVERESSAGEQLGRRYVGGTPGQFPERYAFTNPIGHVSPGAPPTLIYQGSADHLVRAEPVRRFAGEIARRGVVTRYVELPGLEHGVGESFEGTIGTIIARSLALEWLRSHLG